MPKCSHVLAWPTRRWLELYGRTVAVSNGELSALWLNSKHLSITGRPLQVSAIHAPTSDDQTQSRRSPIPKSMFPRSIHLQRLEMRVRCSPEIVGSPSL